MAECNHDCSNCNQNCSERDLTIKTNPINKIKKVIGVISAKGGVGKSFVTSLLASKKAKEGFKVGIIDADVTGASIPKAFGLKGPLYGDENNLLVPAVSNLGIKIVSSSLLLDDDSTPILWRGPLLANMVKQFYTDSKFEELDYLFLDMPPGTADIALTVFQSIKMDGIILVTTPQDLVNDIVSKTVEMAKKMNISILGIIQNMSYVVCPKCKEIIHPFGNSNIEKILTKYNLKQLGELPIDSSFAALIDKGLVENIDVNSLDLKY